MRRGITAAGVLLATVLACRRVAVEATRPVATPTPAPAAPAAVWVPGLGELMAFQQMRHAKLWLAGKAGNWALAAYEAGELEEGFQDVARLHPTQKDVPVPIDEAIETIMKEPLARMRDAIAKRNPKAFVEAYDTLTEGCNACHQASNHGFNVVQRPENNAFSNQAFTPPKE